jgi:putative ABC transport system permease protein
MTRRAHEESDGGPQPPALPTRLLQASLPKDARGRSIFGDLIEEWHRRPRGAARAAWYWRECLRVGARYLFVRTRLPGGHPSGGGRAGASSLLPLDDVRHALRRARRSPLASGLTVLALGVGVAAPTLMYSLLVGVTRDLPVPEPDRLVHVGRRFTPSIVRQADLAWLRPLLEQPSAGTGAGLASVGAFALGRFDLSGEDGFPERWSGAYVTPGVFPTVGVPPALGRWISEGDLTTGDAVVVLSDEVWLERLEGDPEAVGRTVRVDGRAHMIVGVMPPGFAFPDAADVWLPLHAPPRGATTAAELVGRFADGSSLEAFQERVAVIMTALQEEGATDVALARPLAAEAWSDRSIGPNERRMLRLMVLLVSFVLVIAVADVIHLFLARALAGRTQTAVRLALGASRWRVVRQHLFDALVLAVAGGLLGLALAAVGVSALAGAMAPRLSWGMEIRLDPLVVLFSTGLVAAAALATAVAPAIGSARLDLASSMRDGARGASGGRRIQRATGLLVVAEVAFTCALVVVAGLLTRGALRSMDTHGDFATATVLTASYELRADRHPGADEIATFHQELTRRIGARPAVVAAGLTSHLPGIFAPSRRVEVEGEPYERPEDRPVTHVVHISPGFLNALGVEPARGRDLTWSDGRADGLVALVNEPFVRAHLSGRDPLGARIRLAPDERAPAGAAAPEWATVVGVVPPLGLRTGRDPDDTGIYLPMAAAALRTASLLARARPGAHGSELAPLARAEAAALDADLALDDMASLEERLRANRDMESLFATLFQIFGASGLLLAGVGLYGLMVFTVGRRVRELGIRSALGARPGRVAWTAVRGGALQVSVGLLLGMGFAATVAPLFGTLFMGYQPRDAVAYGVAVLTLLGTGVAAALGPARRAISSDVADVLRAE